MEVCGGQTHSIVRYGIDRMLPPDGRAGARPGLPGVRHLARDDRPGARHRRAAGRHLHLVRRHAARARLARRSAAAARVAAPTCASSTRRSTRVGIARENPDEAGRLLRHRLRDHRARQRDGGVAGAASRACANFSMLVSHVLVPPAIAAILQAPGNRVQAFLGPGHVCAVMGYREYEALAARYRVPIVITGFEPVDLLEGVLDGGAAARGGPRRRSRTSTRAPVTPRGKPTRRRRSGRRGVRGHRSQVARRRRDPEVRLPAALRVPRARRRAAVRGRGDRDRASRRSASAGWSCAG